MSLTRYFGHRLEPIARRRALWKGKAGTETPRRSSPEFHSDAPRQRANARATHPGGRNEAKPVSSQSRQRSRAFLVWPHGGSASVRRPDNPDS